MSYHTDRKLETVTEENIHEAIAVINRVPFEIYWDYNDELPDEIIKQWYLQWDKYHELPETVLYDYLFEHDCLSYEYQLNDLRERLDASDFALSENDDDEIIPQLFDHMTYYVCTEYFKPYVQVVLRYDCAVPSGYSIGRYGIDEGTKTTALLLGLSSDAIINPDHRDGIDKDNLYEFQDGVDSWDGSHEPYVTAHDFIRELVNNTQEYSQLTACLNIPFFDLPKVFTEGAKFTIPKGTNLGLYESINGGGSVFEMELQRDLEVVIGDGDPEGQTNTWYAKPECCIKYGICDVWGQWLG